MVFGVSKTQIQNTLKRKAELTTEYDSNVPLTQKKRVKLTGNEEINNLLHKWFIDATNRKQRGMFLSSVHE